MIRKSLLAYTAAISATVLLSACGGGQGGSRDQVRAVAQGLLAGPAKGGAKTAKA